MFIAFKKWWYLKRFKSENLNVRYRAVAGLSRLGWDGVSALVEIFEADSTEVRSLIANSLGKSGDTRAANAIARCMLNCLDLSYLEVRSVENIDCRERFIFEAATIFGMPVFEILYEKLLTFEDRKLTEE